MILACTLIFFAAVFNVVMDKTKDTIQYESSIFCVAGLSPLFWNDEAWKGKYLPFTEYKSNAWHISKSLMLFCLLAIPFVYESFLGYFDYVIFGTLWIQTFNLFHKNLFKDNLLMIKFISTIYDLCHRKKKP